MKSYIDFFDKESLIIASTRYFLGRMSIEISFYTKSLVKSWIFLPNRVKYIIQLDLEQSFKDDDKSRAENDKHHPLGMDMDRKAWEEVRKCYENDNIS